MRFVRCALGALVLGAGLLSVGTSSAKADPSTFSFVAVLETWSGSMWAPASWDCAVDCPAGEGTWVMTTNLGPVEVGPVKPVSRIDGDGTWAGWCGLAGLDGKVWLDGYDAFDVHLEWVGTMMVVTGSGPAGTLTGSAQVVYPTTSSPRPTACTLEPGMRFQVAGELSINATP